MGRLLFGFVLFPYSLYLILNTPFGIITGPLAFCYGVYLVWTSLNHLKERASILRRARELSAETGLIDIGQLAADVGITASEVCEMVNTLIEEGKLDPQVKIVK